jgi:hypothetical protein
VVVVVVVVVVVAVGAGQVSVVAGRTSPVSGAGHKPSWRVGVASKAPREDRSRRQPRARQKDG